MLDLIVSVSDVFLSVESGLLLRGKYVQLFIAEECEDCGSLNSARPLLDRAFYGAPPNLHKDVERMVRHDIK